MSGNVKRASDRAAVRATMVLGAAIVALAGASGLAAASPPGAHSTVAEARITPVRRTTIATADPEGSLRFWRDLLGFAVEYDREVTEPGQLAAFAPGAVRGRAIALRQGAGLGGSVGLFHAPGMTSPRRCDVRATGGAVAVLLLTDDAAALARRLRAAGVPFVNDLHAYDQGRGPTDTFTVFDPNCVRVAFAQIRRETLDESLRR